MKRLWFIIVLQLIGSNCSWDIFKKYFLFILVIFCSIEKAEPCSFIPTSFCHNISYRSDDVFLLKFIQSDTTSCKAIVIETLKGNVPVLDTIIIYNFVTWCMDYDTMKLNSIGSVGDTFLIQLPKIDTVINSWDTIGNYRFHDFMQGTNELKYSSDTLSGYITGISIAPYQFKIHKMEYDFFKINWLNGYLNCDSLVVGINKTNTINNASIFPNPANNQIEISIPPDAVSKYRNSIQFQLYDITGKMMETKEIFTEKTLMPISQVPQGIYYWRMVSKNQILQSGKLAKY
jgi:hypothetical protein